MWDRAGRRRGELNLSVQHSPTQTNPKNDRAKRDYLIWLKEAKQRSAKTVEQARHAIDRLEIYTGYKDFVTFNKDQAIAFKQSLRDTLAVRSGKPMKIATIHHTLQAVKDFLIWLRERSGYQRIKLYDIDYLKLTFGEESQAHAPKPKIYPVLEQYRTALFAMPSATDIEKRDRAIMALLLLTIMRDGALIGLKLRHYYPDTQSVFQNPSEISVKFSKAIMTTFLPVGDDVAAIFLDWMRFLREERGFTDDDPIFPKTAMTLDANQNFAPSGLSRDHWATATAVRDIFKTAFANVGLPFTKPHTVRDTIVKLGRDIGLTVEEWVAWSLNTGHASLMTTVTSYAPMTQEEHVAVIRRQRQPKTESIQPSIMAAQVAEIYDFIKKRSPI